MSGVMIMKREENNEVRSYIIRRLEESVSRLDFPSASYG
jgi:hypothetical protein